MEQLLLSVGLISLLAAILGGGLKGLGFEFPELPSRSRQVLLAIFGCILLAASQPDRISGYYKDSLTMFFPTPTRVSDSSGISADGQGSHLPLQRPEQLGREFSGSEIAENIPPGNAEGQLKQPMNFDYRQQPERKVDERGFLAKFYVPRADHNATLFRSLKYVLLVIAIFFSSLIILFITLGF